MFQPGGQPVGLCGASPTQKRLSFRLTCREAFGPNAWEEGLLARGGGGGACRGAGTWWRGGVLGLTHGGAVCGVSLSQRETSPNPSLPVRQK